MATRPPMIHGMTMTLTAQLIRSRFRLGRRMTLTFTRMISMMTTTTIRLMIGMPLVTLETRSLCLSLILLTIRPLLMSMR